jgi:hypothetical protein
MNYMRNITIFLCTGVLLLVGVAVTSAAPLWVVHTEYTPNSTPFVQSSSLAAPRLAYNEEASVVFVYDTATLPGVMSTWGITQTVDIALSKDGRRFGMIDKNQHANLWLYGSPTTYVPAHYEADNRSGCNLLTVRTLSVANWFVGCRMDSMMSIYIDPLSGDFNISNFPSMVNFDDVQFHGVESRWGIRHGVILSDDGVLLADWI